MHLLFKYLEHWKLIFGDDVTRASLTSRCPHHGRRIQLCGEDLEQGARENLLGTKAAGLDQLADRVAAGATSPGRLAQGQPGSVFLGRLVGVDVADTVDRADPMGGPGLALSGRLAHRVERGRDVLIGPAARHAANDRQGVLGGTASCSPVRGLRRRNSECCPPFQWTIRTIARTASSPKWP
jgi:hypothetical protein